VTNVTKYVTYSDRNNDFKKYPKKRKYYGQSGFSQKKIIRANLPNTCTRSVTPRSSAGQVCKCQRNSHSIGKAQIGAIPITNATNYTKRTNFLKPYGSLVLSGVAAIFYRRAR
jgi:hypothetical protein